jgi:hypothetical protein
MILLHHFRNSEGCCNPVLASLVLLVSWLGSTVGCSGQASSDGKDVPGVHDTMADLAADVPNGLDLAREATQQDMDLFADVEPLRQEWQQVQPGGDTACSTGEPFRFFVHPGDRRHVLVYLQGGGACWNDLTCTLGAAMSPQEAPTFQEFMEGVVSHQYDGVLDRANPDNLFASWTVVYVPYCTSDIHWGRTTREYAGGLVQHHKGFFNAAAALGWVFDHVDQPEMVVMSGCSAGGYGALLHSAYVAQHYPQAKVRVLVDAAAGITTPSFIRDSLTAWDALPSLTGAKPLSDVDVDALGFEDVFRRIADYWPQHRYALYSTAHDGLQKFIYKAMGGKDTEWPDLLLDAANTLLGALPNYRCYVPAGTLHCVLPFRAFYLREVNGVPLLQWVREFVLAPDLPAAQICEGADCERDPLCEDCANSTETPVPFYCLACTGGTGGY